MENTFFSLIKKTLKEMDVILLLCKTNAKIMQNLFQTIFIPY